MGSHELLGATYAIETAWQTGIQNKLQCFHCLAAGINEVLHPVQRLKLALSSGSLVHAAPKRYGALAVCS